MSLEGSQQTVLVVDDEVTLRSSMRRFLTALGHATLEAASCAEARALLADHDIDVALVDVRLPDGFGYELCDDVARKAPHAAVIVMTGDPSVENAIAALRRGAADFLMKPFSLDALRGALHELERRREDAAPAAEESLATWRQRYAASFIGGEARVLYTLGVVQRIADTDCTVLVTGESGTGKEIIARALHLSSPRAAQPFVVVNCAAIPETLFESELFGHVRGAFTGAVASHKGAFASAHDGTLFLDEVGELPLFLQPKLLRVLQEKEVTPVGAAQSQPVNVRVVAATNRDLDAMVQAGTFREDLLYRLNGMPVELPPLRERPDDLAELVRHFLVRYAQRNDVAEKRISAGALARMRSYDWPGNVRELENAIDRMCILCPNDEIDEADLPVEVRAGHELFAVADLESPTLPPEGIDLRAALRHAEDRLIRTALEATEGNRNRASALLGMNRTTLSEKLKRRG